MKRIHVILIALAAALLAGGCVVHGTGTMHASATVRTPTLVYVAPGVQVVEDYHEPVFYSDGYYWRYYNGVWYRSHVHYGSWARVTVVPVHVRRIDRPHTYVRYKAHGRGHGHAHGHHKAPPPRATVRDHRGGPPGHAGRPAPEPRVKVRDHRGGDDDRKVDKKKDKKKDAPPPRVKVRDHR